MFCKRITVKNINGSKPHVYLGLITEESEFLITFQTRKKKYTYSKSQILEISDTKEVFHGSIENQAGNGRRNCQGGFDQ
tara:strand:+ start:152 stop:388 length:237 start_codon:yes stop_codon:yes gene_type:complete